MKILFTGASSFSGMWFARELARQGCEVTAVYQRKSARDYEDDTLRARRVDELAGVCQREFGCSFGDAKFMRLAAQRWDLFCNHAADVGDFRAPGYDVAAAFAANTRNLPEVLRRLRENGCGAAVLTGSVFERGEGEGSGGLPAVLPYGLAKTITSEAFVFRAQECGMRLGKFVIPNPFGPFEGRRFTAYLAGEWQNKRTAQVRTPEYVRDNIHISLLALCYADFARRFARGKKQTAAAHPSGYVEKQGAFAKRFAREMKKRWNLPCKVECAEQKDFPEPKKRVNTGRPDIKALAWNEKAAWDGIADYYRNTKEPRK